MTQIDLSENKKFKNQNVKIADGEDCNINVIGAIQEQQVGIQENGSNIVLTAYGTKENVASWQKVETTTDSFKISEGPNKGKYFQTVTTYVREGDSWIYSSMDNKYVKTKGNGQPVTTYNALDSDSNIIATFTKEPDDFSTGTIVDTNTILGTVTIKNANKAATLNLNIVDNEIDLLSQVYAPVHKGNKYTGTFLKEETESTSANENFNLGIGNDTISYNFSERQGKDAIVVNNDENLTLEFNNTEDVELLYSKKGNDAVVTVSRQNNTDWKTLSKTDNTVTKNNNGTYLLKSVTYAYNFEAGQFSEEGYEYNQELSAAEYKVYAASMGLKVGKTVTMYSGEKNDGTYSGSKKMPKLTPNYDTVTLKNYFKVGDGATVGGDFDKNELINVLNATYDRHAETKAQTIKDTFLNETLIGGSGKDNITSSGGVDTITGNAGNDTITLGTGEKTININSGDGNDTIVKAQNANSVNINYTGVKDYFFTKTGNDLVINYTGDEDAEDSSYKKTTIKNYFGKYDKTTKNYDHTTMSISVDEELKVEDLTSALKLGESDEYGEAVEFNYANDNKTKTITGTDLSDYIIAGSNTTKINAGEGNNTVVLYPLPNIGYGKMADVYAGTGDDTYYVQNMCVSHDITDKGGNDIIEIAQGGDYADEYNVVFDSSEMWYELGDFTLLFDVIGEGKSATKNNDLTTMRVLYNNNYEDGDIAYELSTKGARGLKSTINIQNFFNKDGSAGTGCVETFKVGENSVDFSEENFDQLNELRGEIAGWLTSGGRNYQSAMAVLSSNNYDDISELIQMYSSVTMIEAPEILD